MICLGIIAAAGKSDGYAPPSAIRVHSAGVGVWPRDLPHYEDLNGKPRYGTVLPYYDVRWADDLGLPGEFLWIFAVGSSRNVTYWSGEDVADPTLVTNWVMDIVASPPPQITGVD